MSQIDPKNLIEFVVKELIPSEVQKHFNTVTLAEKLKADQQFLDLVKGDKGDVVQIEGYTLDQVEKAFSEAIHVAITEQVSKTVHDILTDDAFTSSLQGAAGKDAESIDLRQLADTLKGDEHFVQMVTPTPDPDIIASLLKSDEAFTSSLQGAAGKDVDEVFVTKTLETLVKKQQDLEFKEVMEIITDAA
jgi:Tfp pilus assembly major pilin PilA